jgi:hypothetical protein
VASGSNPADNLSSLSGTLPDPTAPATASSALPLPVVNSPQPAASGDWLHGLIDVINSVQPGQQGPPQVALNTSGPAVQIDLPTVKQCITDYQAMLVQLLHLHRRGHDLTGIQNPGDDDDSITYADQANSVGGSHQQANQTLQAAVQAHIDKLTAIVQQYEATEQGNAANITRQAP